MIIENILIKMTSKQLALRSLPFILFDYAKSIQLLFPRSSNAEIF